MSTKFVVVKEEPKELHKDAYVIKPPSFLEEILLNKRREPRGGITAINHLRAIVHSIGSRYDENLTEFSVRPSLFEGRLYASDEELSVIVKEMLESQYPQIFDKYLDFQVKNRPRNVKLIYVVGDHVNHTALYRNGIDHLDPKEVEVFLGLKPKKIVGKPAVTNEESNESDQ